MIRTAIVGVGNCAKSLIEGVGYYSRNKTDVFGLMHPIIGRFHPSDIDFVTAFDIDERKVGLRLHDSINSDPNNTMVIDQPLKYNFIVQRGPTLDGIIKETKGIFIKESNLPVCDLVRVLKDSKAEVVINYIPSGSDQATYAYAEAAINANCSFINCMSTPIAKDNKWRKRFEDEGLVLLGDDIKSQLGSTIINHSILQLLKMRGTKVNLSQQTNYGGNADHFNLKYRNEAKKSVKLASLKSCLDATDASPEANMVYKEKNFDHKESNILIKGEIFGRIPWSVELTINNEDSPNSAGVVVDAIRMTKLLIDTGKVQFSKDVCSFLMKYPPVQYSEEEGYKIFNDVIKNLI